MTLSRLAVRVRLVGTRSTVASVYKRCVTSQAPLSQHTDESLRTGQARGTHSPARTRAQPPARPAKHSTQPCSPPSPYRAAGATGGQQDRAQRAAPSNHGGTAARPQRATLGAAAPACTEQWAAPATRVTEVCTLTTFGGLTFSALLTRDARTATPPPARREARRNAVQGARPDVGPAVPDCAPGSLKLHRLPRHGNERAVPAPGQPPRPQAGRPQSAQCGAPRRPHGGQGARGGDRPRPASSPAPVFRDPTARWERHNPFDDRTATAAHMATAAPPPYPASSRAQPPPRNAGPAPSANAFSAAMREGRPHKRSPPPRGGLSPRSPAHARSRFARGKEPNGSSPSPPRAGDAEDRAMRDMAREGALCTPGPRGTRNEHQKHDVRRLLLAATPPQRDSDRPPPRRGGAPPSFSSPLSRGKEPLDDRVRRLTAECGLDVPLGDSRGDEFTTAASGTNRAFVARLDDAAATRVHDVADRERLGTALTWFLGFLRDTERVPFVDPDKAGGLGYNQKTLELFAEYIRLKGSKRPGFRGTQLNSDTIAAYVGAVKLAATRIQRRPLVSKEDNIRLPMQMKQMRREQAPPGSSHNGVGSAEFGAAAGGRALCRGLRAHHLRDIADHPSLDRTSRQGVQDWAAALLAHNLLLRGGELGRSSKSGWDPRRGLTLESLDFRRPCPESEGCPWVIVRMVAIKDVSARHAPVFIPVRRRATFEAVPADTDPLDAYDAVRRAWLARDAEVPAHRRHEAPLFTSAAGGSYAAWTTDDSRRLAREYGRMANIASADIGGKAFRVGGATDMRDALGDASIHLIKQRGRWASDVAQVYQRALVRSHLTASVLMSSNAAASRDMEELVKGWAQPAICR